MTIGIIGGGAAGFFGAIRAAEMFPQHKIILFEKTDKVLAKVRVSGGGRCNVTHHCFNIKQFSSNYPRGGRAMHTLFAKFSAKDTVEWFETRGVQLKVEEDGRMFPITDDSSTIVNCLFNEVNKLGVNILYHQNINKIEVVDGGFILYSTKENYHISKLLVTTGGNPSIKGYEWLSELGIEIIKPLPSLFTFRVKDFPLVDLSGIAVENTVASIENTKLEQQAPTLITHWGFSAPAILKLSAWGARILHEMNYNFTVRINWAGEKNEELIKDFLNQYKTENPKRQITNYQLFDIPQRLWRVLCEKAEIPSELRWVDISKKQFNKLLHHLSQDAYLVNGKSTFKEEFVTCGGVALSEVNLQTMESKKIKGLFFAGEVLDIDGITGGFNFQAAWTTAWVAGTNIGL